jgi:regulator of sigma D
MSKFSLRDVLSLPCALGSIFTKCGPTARKEDSQEKLNKQVLFHKYKLDDLSRQIVACESNKLACVRSKNLEGAKEAVKEKFKLVKKKDKVREIYDFCLTLLDQISEAASVKETINTLADAQRTFGNMNAPMLYQKMDNISKRYVEFKDVLSDTNSMLADNFNAGSASEPTDEELLAELQQLEQACAEDSQALPSVPLAAPTGGSVLQTYRQAGFA